MYDATYIINISRCYSVKNRNRQNVSNILVVFFMKRYYKMNNNIMQAVHKSSKSNYFHIYTENSQSKAVK